MKDDAVYKRITKDYTGLSVKKGLSHLFLVLGDGPGVGSGVPAWLMSSMLAKGAKLDIRGVIIMLAGHVCL